MARALNPILLGIDDDECLSVGTAPSPAQEGCALAFQAYRHTELSDGYMPKDGLSLIMMDSSHGVLACMDLEASDVLFLLSLVSLVGHTSFCLLVVGS